MSNSSLKKKTSRSRSRERRGGSNRRGRRDRSRCSRSRNRSSSGSRGRVLHRRSRSKSRSREKKARQLSRDRDSEGEKEKRDDRLGKQALDSKRECIAWKKNECRYGDSCRYFHSGKGGGGAGGSDETSRKATKTEFLEIDDDMDLDRAPTRQELRKQRKKEAAADAEEEQAPVARTRVGQGFTGGWGGGGGREGEGCGAVGGDKKKEDWICHECNATVFASKAECYKCGAKRIVEKSNKEKPNYEASGKLGKNERTVNGIVVSYTEPTEARMPPKGWRLYVFKDKETLPPISLNRQSAYLVGRERKIADIPIDHPSCSKQHAVVQFKQKVKESSVDGTLNALVRPYVIDLGSTNGTHLNGKQIESLKYYELLQNDVLKFGFSTREYVVIHEGAVSAKEAAGDAGAGSGKSDTLFGHGSD